MPDIDNSHEKKKGLSVEPVLRHFLIQDSRGL